MKDLFIDQDITQRRKETDMGKQSVLMVLKPRISFTGYNAINNGGSY